MNRPIKPPKPLPSSTVMSKELPKDEERVQESIEEKNPSASLPPTAQPVTPPPPPPTLSATGSSSKGLQTVLKNDSSDEKKVLKVEKRVNFQEDKPAGRSPPEAHPPPLPSNPSIKKSAFLTPEHWAGKNIGQRPFQTPNKYQLSPTTELDTSQSSSAAPGGGAVVTSGPGGVGVGAAGFPLKPIVLSPSEDEKLSDRLRMYHNIHYSDEWLMLTIFMHITLFTFLLTIGYDALTPVSLTILLIAAMSVVLLLLFSRYHVGKLPRSLDWSQNVIRTPDQETDLITDDTIYLIGIAACIEGFALALYPVVTARYSRQNHVIEQDGFTSYTTLVQILAFGSLVIFGFYKILRPANRLDPLRTIFELEIVSICWDALDGSTLYELIAQDNVSYHTSFAARVLICFWYFSVGIRIAMMSISYLSPSSYLYRLFLHPALSWSPEPTVDRTLSGMFLRSNIALIMIFPQIYAALLRLTLLLTGSLSLLQQELMFKNFLFLWTVASVIITRMMIKQRNWNTRELIDFVIPFLNYHLHWIKPSRNFQIEVLRYLFIITYLIIGTLLSTILIEVTPESTLWINNIASDLICCLIFFCLCWRAHYPTVWILFPFRTALTLGILLLFNLFAARLPAIYRHASELAKNETNGGWSYNNAMFVVLLSIIPISSYALFWSVCNMLFHSEFTACPEDYNAVHDPAITLVSTNTMLEGALDIVSCASLLSLATNPQLPAYVDGIVICFSFLEMCNACQGFVLQVLLSSGYNDTPAHLVKWRSHLRLGRGIVDLGTFILRLSLWIRYNAVTSVFLVKNVLNILQTISLIERSRGVNKYQQEVLFIQYVRPKDWYGMSQEEWRDATRLTIVDQARSGRVV